VNVGDARAYALTQTVAAVAMIAEAPLEAGQTVDGASTGDVLDVAVKWATVYAALDAMKGATR